MSIWCVSILWIISLISGLQGDTYLQENVQYQWWDFGSGETKHFEIYTANHTEQLSVYITDLRSAHADGHGASLNTYQYVQNTNFTFYDVSSPRQGYLSVVATFSQAIKLVPGIPTHVILNSDNEFALFEFETSSNTQILTIALTPFEGKPLGYISNSSIPNADDSSTFQYTIYSHINIKENNTNTYYILTKNANQDSTSRFYITASTFHTHILLQSGVPRQDDVDYESSRYYYFNVTELNCALGILLTVIQGNADLFVSTTNDYPDINDYDLMSQHFGSDYILIEDASVNLYYIGVHPTANTNVKYSISSILKCDHNKYFTYLMDGISQMNVLKSNEWAFYKFEFNFNHTISEILIQINPSSGDPDLYLDIDITNTSNPKAWRYKAEQYGADHIRLSSKDYFTICKQDTEDTFCTLDIAVLGYSSSIYTIMVSSSDSHTSLQNGKPNTGYISAESPYTYYQFDLDNNLDLLRNNNITISMTPSVISTSDTIDTVFYVDGGINTLPNIDNGYKYKSQDSVHPFAMIDGADIITQGWNELYIGVTSNENITFTIVLTIGTEIQLQDGHMQLGHVSLNHRMYYEFIMNENDEHNQNLQIIATSLHGDINVFVSRNGMIPDPNNATTYDFVNNQNGVSVKRISVNNTQSSDDCVHSLCRYYITISTNDWNEEAEYYIIAATDYAVIPLFDGQPITSDLHQHELDYFSIQIDYSYKNEPALFIEVTPTSGNVDLYLSDDEANHRPDMNQYSFKSEQSGGNTDSIIIDLAKEGVYYIGVYAVEQHSTYSITGTLSNGLRPGFIRLLSGVPQQGSILTFGTSARFYQIYVPHQATLLKVHISHTMFPVKAYIARNISNDAWPSSHNYIYILKSGTLNIENPLRGSYYVGIYSHILSYFSITATLSNDILFIRDGQSISGRVMAHQYDYYQMQLHDATQDFTVSLTSFAGDADLYISLNKRPTISDSVWTSKVFGSDVVTISHSDPLACNVSSIQCIYIIAIYGYRNSLYSITATTQESIELQDGIPIQGEIAANQWHYYKFSVTNAPLMLVVGLTLISGQNDLFINLNSEPTSSSYLYSSYSMNQDKNIQIEHISCPYNQDNQDWCVYFIGIHGITQSQYSVFYQSSNTDSEFLIEDSIPMTRSIDADQFIFFKYNVLSSLKDVIISLTPITGTPQCFVSSLMERPTVTHHEYAITNGANSINIGNVANNTIYHITVFSSTQCTFTLSVIGEHYNRSADTTGIRLIEGKMAYGATDDWAYYSFLPSMTSSNDIIISVYALSGDPDIFCNLKHYPTLHRYLYSTALDGPETLTIPHLNDTYLCGIHADNNANTEFYIIAYHAHSIVTLIEDIPVIGELNAKNNVNYYHFIAQSLDIEDGGVVSLIFTPIYASQCSIFISCTTYHPNETHHQYAVNNSVQNGLNGIDFKISKEELLISTDWYIAIKKSRSALYTLLLTYDNVTTLQEGLPQNGQISKGQVSYYIWNIALSDKEENEALFVSLSLLSGDCTVYISRNPLMINSCNNGIGCPKGLFDFYHACSDKSPAIINQKDDYYISSVGTYYISVTATAAGNTDTYYNIIAYTSYTILYLSNAIPTWDAIQKNQYKYYSLFCNTNLKSLDLMITPITPINDIIINGIISTTRSRPNGNATQDEYVTQWVDDHGAIFSISKTNQHFISSKQYFISLSATQDAIYTISAVATPDNSTQYRALMNNMQQMAVIHATDHRYYSFHSQTQYYTSITFTLQVAQGQISMYVVDNKNINMIPSLQSHQYKLEKIDTKTKETAADLVITDPCDCSYLIAIVNNDESESIYSIRVEMKNPNANADPHLKAEKRKHVALYVVGVIVCIAIVVLSLIGVVNYIRNKRLKYELDIAEMQLNMQGQKTLRQRREELESTTSGPAKPWNSNKKKYTGIRTHDNDDNDSANLLNDDSVNVLVNDMSGDDSARSDTETDADKYNLIK